MSKPRAKTILCLMAAVLLPLLLAQPILSQSEELQAYLDIKPDSCENPLNTTSYGKVMMAILGTEDFDVTKIDQDSLYFVGKEGTSLDYINIFFDNVSGPPEGEFSCSVCYEDSDDYADLMLQFFVEDIVAFLEANKESGSQSDDRIQLTIKGFIDGTPFYAFDCINPFNVTEIGNNQEIFQEQHSTKTGNR